MTILQWIALPILIFMLICSVMGLIQVLLCVIQITWWSWFPEHSAKWSERWWLLRCKMRRAIREFFYGEPPC